IQVASLVSSPCALLRRRCAAASTWPGLSSTADGSRRSRGANRSGAPGRRPVDARADRRGVRGRGTRLPGLRVSLSGDNARPDRGRSRALEPAFRRERVRTGRLPPRSASCRRLSGSVAGLGRSAGWDDRRAADDGRRLGSKARAAHGRPVSVVSFTFGCPSREVIESLKAAGSEVWLTVTNPDEAAEARGAGADVLVAQGAEAGGHRASFVDRPGLPVYGLLALLRSSPGPSRCRSSPRA